MVKQLITYLRQRLRKKETFMYAYYDARNAGQKREVAHKEIPYTLYLLAMAGKPDFGTMNYYKANPKLLTLDGKYLLACAYALAGDRSKYSSVLPTAYEGEIPEKELGGSFSSSIRDRALILNALISVDPDNQQIGIMAKHLQKDLKIKRYRNTQERVFSLLALGKVARLANKGKIEAKVKVNGNLIAQTSGEDISVDFADLQGGKVEIETSGDGKLFYFWNLEGLSKDGKNIVEEDNFIKVRRNFYDRFGRKIDKNTFEQNDLIVVELSLISKGSDNVPNVVITDMLPAGFEVENPRITDKPAMDWIKGASRPEHQDFRDDRVHLFTYASNKYKYFYYVVRAVSPGYFQLGPVSADAMYDGEYHSYHGAGTVKVKAKK